MVYVAVRAGGDDGLPSIRLVADDGGEKRVFPECPEKKDERDTGDTTSRDLQTDRHCDQWKQTASRGIRTSLPKKRTVTTAISAWFHFFCPDRMVPFMRSVSSPGWFLRSQALIPTTKPKNMIRKIHPAGQTIVPAGTKRANAKTTNLPATCPIGCRTIAVIGGTGAPVHGCSSAQNTCLSRRV